MDAIICMLIDCRRKSSSLGVPAAPLVGTCDLPCRTCAFGLMCDAMLGPQGSGVDCIGCNAGFALLGSRVSSC